MRYIDADKLLNNLPDDLPYKASVKRVLIQAPTEDVVPKSEVEKLQNEVVVWKQNRFNLFQRLELYEEIRKKVVREIFEEIETSCRTLKVWGIYGYLMSDIAELKKKYTESEGKE